MKIQHVKIGKHYEHVINYEKNDFVENYILSTEELGINKELLRIIPEFFYVVTGFGDNDGTQYYIKNIDVVPNGDVVDLTILFTENQEEKVSLSNNQLKNDYVSFDIQNDGTFTIHDRREGSNIITYRVNFQLVNEKNKHSIQIIVAPATQIYDVMLDYGSEATQMYIARRNDVLTQANQVNLFPIMSGNIKEELYDNYIQHDLDTDKFYKSIIFINRKIDQQIDSIDSFQQQLMPLLTKKEAEDKAKKKEIMLLPNQKLYNWGGIQFEQIMYNNTHTYPHVIGDESSGGGNSLLYKSCLAYFVKVAVDQVNINSKGKAVLSLHLMMPNVYSEENVSEKIHNMYDVLGDILKNLGNDKNKIVGFDVTAVSESDASLIGAHQVVKETRDPYKDGFYLVIDAGKGTLDMSLSKISNDSIATYWRDCIIGSGNYISYLILLDVLASIGKEQKEISDFINDMVNSSDEYAKDQLMTHIETIKKGYNKIKQQTIWEKNTSARTLIEVKDYVGNTISPYILSNKEPFSPSTGSGSNRLNGEGKQLSTKYLEDGIEQYIKDEFIPKIKQMHRTLREQGGGKLYILFSGRASRFDIFKDAMYNAIVDEVCNYFIDENKYQSWINKGLRRIRKEMKWGVPELKKYTSNDSAVEQKNVCLMSLSKVREGNVHRKMLLDRVRISSAFNGVNVNEGDVVGNINTERPLYEQRG